LGILSGKTDHLWKPDTTLMSRIIPRSFRDGLLPEKVGYPYYDLACIYAFRREKEEALNYWRSIL
jgi:hypothetical protein